MSFVQIQALLTERQQCKTLKDEILLTTAIGDHYFVSKQFENALEEYLHLCDLLEDAELQYLKLNHATSTTANPASCRVQDRMYAIRCASECCIELVEWSKALKFAHKYHELATGVSDHVEVQRALTTLGRAYMCAGTAPLSIEVSELSRFQNLWKGKTYLDESIHYCKRVEKGSGNFCVEDAVAISIYNEGLIFLDLGRLSDAEKMFKRCLQLYKSPERDEDRLKVVYSMAELAWRHDSPQFLTEFRQLLKESLKKLHLFQDHHVRAEYWDKLLEFTALCELCQRRPRKSAKVFRYLWLHTRSKDMVKKQRYINAMRKALRFESLLQQVFSPPSDPNAAFAHQTVYDQLGDISLKFKLPRLALQFYTKRLELIPKSAWSTAEAQFSAEVETQYTLGTTLHRDLGTAKDVLSALTHYVAELSLRNKNREKKTEPDLVAAESRQLLLTLVDYVAACEKLMVCNPTQQEMWRTRLVATQATHIAKACKAFQNARPALTPQEDVSLLARILAFVRTYPQGQGPLDAVQLTETEDQLVNLLESVKAGMSEEEVAECFLPPGTSDGDELTEDGVDVDRSFNSAELQLSSDSELESYEDKEEEEEEPGDQGRGSTESHNAKRKVIKKWKPNERGESPLHVACIHGQVRKVASLLQQGHPVDVRDAAGWQPLHEAVNHGHLQIVKLLLKHGANLEDEGPPDEQSTPLLEAANGAHAEIVLYLLRKGANIWHKNVRGETLDDLWEAAKKRCIENKAYINQAVADYEAVVKFVKDMLKEQYVDWKKTSKAYEESISKRPRPGSSSTSTVPSTGSSSTVFSGPLPSLRAKEKQRSSAAGKSAPVDLIEDTDSEEDVMARPVQQYKRTIANLGSHRSHGNTGTGKHRRPLVMDDSDEDTTSGGGVQEEQVKENILLDDELWLIDDMGKQRRKEKIVTEPRFGPSRLLLNTGGEKSEQPPNKKKRLSEPAPMKARPTPGEISWGGPLETMSPLCSSTQVAPTNTGDHCRISPIAVKEKSKPSSRMFSFKSPPPPPVVTPQTTVPPLHTNPTPPPVRQPPAPVVTGADKGQEVPKVPPPPQTSGPSVSTRVLICITYKEGQSVTVPVIDLSNTCAWLLDEFTKRYNSIFEESPIQSQRLILKTYDGVDSLAAWDPLELVLPVAESDGRVRLRVVDKGK